jgi:hypothetical protein
MVTGGMPEPSTGNDLAIGVHRVPATLVFAVSCFMWALTALALIMVVGDIRSTGPIDGSLIALLGVPLFAFPAVRDSVRNAPGLGVLGDYLRTSGAESDSVSAWLPCSCSRCARCSVLSLRAPTAAR